MGGVVKQTDLIEEISGALVQHGPLNRRAYLMKLGAADPHHLVGELSRLAERAEYTKIFAKIPASAQEAFVAAGFQIEARIPGFYRNREEALFLGRYFDPSRRLEEGAAELDQVRKTSQLQTTADNHLPGKNIEVRMCVPEDIDRLAEIYERVFQSYPFPINNPEYIRETMLANVVYFGIEEGGQLVAVSSSELDESSRTVEMTDFATLPAWRSHGFAQSLLTRMDKSATDRGVRVAYSIARALSPGINVTFAKHGYTYAGRLINNTNIFGRIESMNVWYKRL